MSLAGPLCSDLGTSIKWNKNQLCDFMTTEPPVSRDPSDAGIPGENFLSNHAYLAAWRMN